MKLRTRVVLLLLAILLPAFAGFAWIMTRNIQNAQLTLRNQVLNRAHAIRVSMDQELERRETVLGLLVNSPSLQNWDLPAFCRLARSVVQVDTGPIVLARGGEIMMGTSNENCSPLVSGIGRVPDPITSGRVHLSDLFKRSLGDQIMVLFTTFVREGSIHELSIGVEPSALQDRLELNTFDPGWTVAVMNRRGRVLARVPEPKAWVGKPATSFAADPRVLEGFWKNDIGPEEGWRQGLSADGVRTNVVFSRSARYGLSVFITYPQSAAEQAAHNTVLEEVFATTGLMLFGLLLAVWAGRKIAEPADALRETAERLKAGQPVTIQRYRVPEFDSVASSLEDASATIRSHNRDLTQKIEAAVAEAKASQLKLLQAQKLEVIGRLTGGIAHDFNNLLQTLSTGLTVLEQLVREPKAQPLIEAGLRAVGRASRLVQQLLAFGRNAPFDRQSIDLRRLLSRMEVLLARTLSRNIQLQIDISPHLRPVDTDATQLEVALLNLVFNARDAMSAGGEIRILARNDEQDGRQGVALQVIDNGEGIPPELLSQVFEPFVTTKPVGRGTGLGLSQVWDFAQASEGVVGVESTVGVGTTVRLWLPCASAEAPQEPGEVRSPAGAQGGSVLFVEDDALISEVVTSALHNAGFRVRRCPTADEALRCLRAGEHVDVVFSDIVMSGTLSGLQLVEVLRSEFPSVPVILATGYAQSLPDPPPCMLLPKPYPIDRLIEMLARAASSGFVTPGREV